MDNKIEDYLHLYLGCMVELDNDGSKVYDRKLVAVGGVDGEPYCKLRKGTAEKGFVHAVLLKERRVKPTLRQLVSMTDTEKLQLAAFERVWSSDNILPIIKVGRLLNLYHSEKSDQITKWLLDHYFDLFGLIEAGLAIDSTTLNPQGHD
jgi:hypothetical protein